jgi:hypothetical protein
MKLVIKVILLYLIVLISLPTIRVIKLTLHENACINIPSKDCEKGKFIMNLNFSPLQFVNELDLKPELYIIEFKLTKEQSSYEKIFISKFQNSIWHPPKFFI